MAMATILPWTLSSALRSSLATFFCLQVWAEQLTLLPAADNHPQNAETRHSHGGGHRASISVRRRVAANKAT